MIKESESLAADRARILVVGIGGGGGNAVDTMVEAGIKGVQFIAVNTDAQALHKSKANHRFQLGASLTRGLGAGANPEVGREAALTDQDRLAEFMVGADMVFITAGMGGGTGTGAAPVVASIARERGALTVGIVTTPFFFEGRRRMRIADDGVVALKEHVDTLITVPNERLLGMVDEKTSVQEAFQLADGVLLQAVKGIADLVTIDGVVNVDFADVRTVMSNKGAALMGTGVAAGSHRTAKAAQEAVASPLLADASIVGARWILVNITGPEDLRLYEVHEAATLIQEAAHEDVELIWGWVHDPAMGDQVRVTVIATGFEPEDPLRGRTLIEPNLRSRPGLGNRRRRKARPPMVPDPMADMHEYDLPTFLRDVD